VESVSVDASDSVAVVAVDDGTDVIAEEPADTGDGSYLPWNWYRPEYLAYIAADDERRRRLAREPWPEYTPEPDPEVEVEPAPVAAHEYVGSAEVGYHSAGSRVDYTRQVDRDEQDIEDLIALGAFDHQHGFEVLRDERGRISEIVFLEETVS